MNNQNNTTTMPDKSMMMMNLLTLDNSVFATFIFWCSVLGIKMLLMSMLTAAQRFRYKIYPNKEDAKIGKPEIFPNEEDATVGKVEVQFNDPHVERVRRAHRNDMENILPYFSIGLMYVCIDPPAVLATILFRVATIVRILHTLVYAVYPVRQPTRAICFFIQYLITIYMALHVIVCTIKYI